MTNLFCVRQHISNAIDNKAQTVLIYTDLSKAFDKLDYIIISKFNEFGCSTNLVALLWSYGQSRELYTSYNGLKSVSFYCIFWCTPRICSMSSVSCFY